VAYASKTNCPRAGGSSKPIAAEENPHVCERRFWFFGAAVILVLLAVGVFDFSPIPPAYDGVYLTRPFCCLHNRDLVDRAWPARNHLKYGLGYTRGLGTLVVGDPPPLLPKYYISHPPLETWVWALGMLVFGTEDWSVRLVELVVSIPCLFLILLVLRKLYGSICALLSGLLLVLLPLPAYFGFYPLMVLPGLWALYRHLQLTGRVSGAPTSQKRHLVEVGIALFLLVQASWVGVFYAFVLGLHYVATCIARRQVRWKLMVAIALPSLLSVGLNFYIMFYGMRHNTAVESLSADSVLPTSTKADTPWGLILSLYEWRAGTGEREAFSWAEWAGTNLKYAQTNFTALILLLLAGYLFYLVIAYLHALNVWAFHRPPAGSPRVPLSIPHPFCHMWFFLLPGLLFMFVFKGLFWEHQYWQAPFALFVAIGSALTLLSLGEVFARFHPWLGRFVVGALLILVVVFCNQGLAAYRAVRWQSPRTIALFQRLNREIPPDKALLTFQNFLIKENRAKVAHYRPEYAWYLDREMIVANAWQYNPDWVRLARIGDVVEETVREIQAQGQTGRYWFYMIPACEEYRHDPQYQEPGGQPTCGPLLNVGAVSGYEPGRAGACSSGLEEKPRGVAALSEEELDRRLKDHNWDDDELLCWEKHRRYREAVIAELKKLYRWEYCGNPAGPGDEDFCCQGVTPCYLFDLLSPLP
jgi:hypothetical protein